MTRKSYIFCSISLNYIIAQLTAQIPMRIGLILFFIAVAIMANIYTDGKLLKSFYKYTKYYKMAGVGLAALAIYVLFKRSPERARELVFTSHEYLKYMPVDKNASNILNPILDFTSKYSGGAATGAATYFGGSNPILNLGSNRDGRQSYAEARITKSGGAPYVPMTVDSADGANPVKKATKRSVSETKKKYVAAQQGWKCGHCNKQLPAWFEVDHKIRLEHGGSNHIDNLVALCRDCHGEKTAIENL